MIVVYTFVQLKIMPVQVEDQPFLKLIDGNLTFLPFHISSEMISICSTNFIFALIDLFWVIKQGGSTIGDISKYNTNSR